MTISSCNTFHMPHGFSCSQNYNMRLKVVAEAAGIDKPVASHWGRRTCGMLLLNHGVSMETVAKVLGHSSIRTTEQAYAKLLNTSVVREIRDKVGDLE